MGNMSYCRFENTMNDLRDCLRHIAEDAENRRDENSRQEMLDYAQKAGVVFNNQNSFVLKLYQIFGR